MSIRTACLAVLGTVVTIAAISLAAASGSVGIYGIIEKVVFEPSAQAPERVQVFGAFAYADGRGASADGMSPVRRGYLYFRVAPDGARRDQIVTEWRDLAAAAGTGQAVAFGSWGYIAGFGSLDPAERPSAPSVILEMYPGRGVPADMRVRPASEAPSAPAAYVTETGVVRIPEEGNRAEVVRRLKAALAAAR